LWLERCFFRRHEDREEVEISNRAA
jgi:hypothetical protein